MIYKWETTYLTRHPFFDFGPWGQFLAVWDQTKVVEFTSGVVLMNLCFSLVVVALIVAELEQYLLFELI
jgi:hypothetical protein